MQFKVSGANAVGNRGKNGELTIDLLLGSRTSVELRSIAVVLRGSDLERLATENSTWPFSQTLQGVYVYPSLEADGGLIDLGRVTVHENDTISVEKWRMESDVQLVDVIDGFYSRRVVAGAQVIEKLTV